MHLLPSLNTVKYGLSEAVDQQVMKTLPLTMVQERSPEPEPDRQTGRHKARRPDSHQRGEQAGRKDAETHNEKREKKEELHEKSGRTGATGSDRRLQKNWNTELNFPFKYAFSFSSQQHHC